MSTLLEYMTIGPRMEDQPLPWKRPVVPEQYYGQDDYSEFVVFNAYNNGASLAGAWKDELGTQFNTIYNGFYTDDINAFDLRDEDFTIRIQFGLGSYYDYNELEAEYYIPILTLGDLPTANSPFFLAMTNPSTPTNVQKGDFIFSLRDNLGRQAYCFISANDWYMPTFPAVMHLEFSREGQVFTLKYNGLYGQKVVSSTFPLFGSINLAGIARAYILSSSGFGSINSYIRALQITKGISRGIGPNCSGAYTVATRYAKMPMLERRSSASVLLNALSSPIVGLEKIYGAKSYTISEEAVLISSLSSKVGSAAITSVANIVTVGGPPPSDPYWANVAVMFNSDSYASETMSQDAKGNSILWHINDNYTWYSVAPPQIDTVLGEKAINFRSPTAQTYPRYVRRGTFVTPASVNLAANFTIEMLLFMTGDPNASNILFAQFGSSVLVRSSGGIRMFWDQGGINYYLGSGMSAYMDKITYLALTRNNGVLKLYLDAAEVASMAFTANVSGQLTIGTNNWEMALDDKIFSMRVTPGIVRTITPLASVKFPAS